MSQIGLRIKNLHIGDLVTHILYGEKWIGVIVDFKDECLSPAGAKRSRALVQVQPGTEFEGFFRRASKADRINENLGYISVNWLFKIKEKDEDENIGSSRDET